MYIYYGCTVCRVWFINSFRLHLEYKIRNIKPLKLLLLSINYRNQSPSFNLDHRLLLLLLLLLLLDKITLIVDQVHFIELNYRPAGRRRLSR